MPDEECRHLWSRGATNVVRMAAEALMRFLVDEGYIAPEYVPREDASAMEQLRRWERTVQIEDSSVHGSKDAPAAKGKNSSGQSPKPDQRAP